MLVKGTESWCVLECIKDNYYAMFHTHSYHCYKELHFNSRLNVNFDKSHWNVKCRPTATSHGACLKSVSRIIILQDFILTSITATEKCTLYLDFT